MVLVFVGFMTQTEKQIFLSVPSNEFNTYWIPCTWFIHVLRDYKEGHPNLDPTGLKLIMEVSIRGWMFIWILSPGKEGEEEKQIDFPAIILYNGLIMLLLVK